MYKQTPCYTANATAFYIKAGIHLLKAGNLNILQVGMHDEKRNHVHTGPSNICFHHAIRPTTSDTGINPSQLQYVVDLSDLRSAHLSDESSAPLTPGSPHCWQIPKARTELQFHQTFEILFACGLNTKIT